MRTAVPEEELSNVLPALIVDNLLVSGKSPDIVSVEKVSPRIAGEMRRLGYEELSADLLKAFVQTGEIREPDLESEQPVDLKGAITRKFVRGTHG